MGKNQAQLNFCTLFDSNYLAQGLTMINSLLKTNNSLIIYVVAMDHLCYKSLKIAENTRVKIISIDKIEQQYPSLKSIKTKRTKPEYYFSCKGFVCHYLLSLDASLESISYIDSDLYFFSDPKPLLDELKGASVGITKHNFHWLCSHQKKYGLYNAGWITFMKNKEGIKCLEEWMEDCINWCYAYVEGEKYGDQKYLNTWSKKYSGVKVIQHKGANVAPWNIKNYNLKVLNGQIFIGKDVLIFYHFSNLIRLNNQEFKTNLSRVFVKTKGVISDHLYKPYIQNLLENEQNKVIKINKGKFFSLKDTIRSTERAIRTFLYNDRISL
jgi:hypothetical protein